MYEVGYYGGESRRHPGQACDYMIVSINGIELYAEHIYTDIPDDYEEYMAYEDLKEDIKSQALKNGIDPDCLMFDYYNQVIF